LRKRNIEGDRSEEHKDEEELDFAILSSESSSFFSILNNVEVGIVD
jgi:hypothetical protein